MIKELLMCEIIPHLHCYLISQGIACMGVSLMVIIPIGHINMGSNRNKVFIFMVKPLFDTSLTYL
jgi:hypothetical protein